MVTQPLSPADLVEIHCETLYVLDGRGDMVSDNNPFPPERRECCRLHLGWNDQALSYRFRRDVPQKTRDRFAAWLEAHPPVGREHPFYSTESNNLASQRVAQKLGLVRFAWELGIR